MKIAVVAPTPIPSRRANTIQVMKMSQAFAQCGHEVFMAVPGPVKSDRATPPPAWEELAHHYGLAHEPGKQPFQVAWLSARPWLRKYDYGLRVIGWARANKADLLYTRLPQAAAYSSFSGLPTALEVHDLPQGRLGPWFFRRFLNGSGARRLVVITRPLAEDLSGKLGAPLPDAGNSARLRTLIAPDGVDLERYAGLPGSPEARRKLALPERFTAGYTGHLYPGRGVEHLLRLARRLPEMTFLLVGGEAGDIALLREQVKIDGLENLILAGFVPNSELPLYQAACDALLMPYQQRVAASSGGDISRYLSPMKLFEYLACGRPVISGDLPVFHEVLTPKNSLLLPTDDVDAWIGALRELYHNPDLRDRLGKQASQDSTRYTWRNRVERILAGLE